MENCKPPTVNFYTNTFKSKNLLIFQLRGFSVPGAGIEPAQFPTGV